jgi:hypothetical protein
MTTNSEVKEQQIKQKAVDRKINHITIRKLLRVKRVKKQNLAHHGYYI